MGGFAFGEDLQCALAQATALTHGLEVAQTRVAAQDIEIKALRHQLLLTKTSEQHWKNQALHYQKKLHEAQRILLGKQTNSHKFSSQWRGSLSFLAAENLPQLASVCKSMTMLLDDNSVWHDAAGTYLQPIFGPGGHLHYLGDSKCHPYGLDFVERWSRAIRGRTSEARTLTSNPKSVFISNFCSARIHYLLDEVCKEKQKNQELHIAIKRRNAEIDSIFRLRGLQGSHFSEQT